MQNTVAKMKGGLLITDSTFSEAAKATKTRACVSIVFETTEDWRTTGGLETLFIPIVPLQNPDYAEIVSIRQTNGRPANQTQYTLGEIQKDEATGHAYVTVRTSSDTDQRFIVSLRVFSH